MAARGYAWKVLVVGGGLEGLSLAYRLASRGMQRVIVVEGRGVGGPQTPIHSMTSRTVYSSRETVALAVEARKALKKLAGSVKAGGALRETGHIWLLDRREALVFRRWREGLWRQLGVSVEVKPLQEASKMEPLLSGPWEYAAYSPQGGLVDSRALAAAVARAARKAGATIIEGARVDRVEVSGGRVAGVHVEGAGLVPAENVVVAAGAATPALAETAGVAVPIVARRRCVVETEAYASIVSRPVWVPSQDGLMVQAAGGLEVTTASGAIETPRPGVTIDCITGVSALITQAIKGGWGIRVEAARPYFQPITPDRSPVIGRADEWPEGLYILSGFAGHGADVRVYAGEALASLILDGKMPREAQPFTPDRFQKGRLIRESLAG